MSLRMNVIFCIIFILWRSVSGVIYTINGEWGAEVQKCASGGDDNRITTFNISHPIVNILPDIFFDADTIVQVGGVIELSTGSSDPMTLNAWPLYNYEKNGNVKSYQGEIRLVAHQFKPHQIAYAGFTLFISRSGEIKFKNYVYAGSWGAFYCSTAKAFINSIKVAI